MFVTINIRKQTVVKPAAPKMTDDNCPKFGKGGSTGNLKAISMSKKGMHKGYKNFTPLASDKNCPVGSSFKASIECNGERFDLPYEHYVAFFIARKKFTKATDVSEWVTKNLLNKRG
jgi:hypothetical protein